MNRESVSAAAGMPSRKTAQSNPLTLAFIGDSVFDLAVRTSLFDAHDAKPGVLNTMASKRVCAGAQAHAAAVVAGCLSEEEKAVFTRGRNAKPGTIPKHAELSDYAMASALETLIGFLYLEGREQRLMEIFEIVFDVLKETVDKPAPKAFKG